MKKKWTIRLSIATWCSSVAYLWSWVYDYHRLHKLQLNQWQAQEEQLKSIEARMDAKCRAWKNYFQGLSLLSLPSLLNRATYITGVKWSILSVQPSKMVKQCQGLRKTSVCIRARSKVDGPLYGFLDTLEKHGQRRILPIRLVITRNAAWHTTDGAPQAHMEGFVEGIYCFYWIESNKPLTGVDKNPSK